MTNRVKELPPRHTWRVRYNRRCLYCGDAFKVYKELGDHTEVCPICREKPSVGGKSVRYGTGLYYRIQRDLENELLEGTT